MRSLTCALAVLLLTATEALAAPDVPPTRRPTFHDASYGLLGINPAVTLSHPVLGVFDLVCPTTPHPNPFVVIVLDPSQPREDGQGEAAALARHGFGAIVLEPAHASADRIAAAIDALRADTATDRPEPGCRADGRVAVLGILRGGRAALAVARDREAGARPLAAVVAVLTAHRPVLAAPSATPTLFITSQRITTVGATQIVVDRATECDVRSSLDPCWERFGRSNEQHDLAVKRQLVILGAEIEFFRATVERDDLSKSQVETLAQQPSIRIEPEVTHLPPEYSPLFHIGGLVGVSMGESPSLALAVRPEVMLARVREAALGSFDVTRAIGIGIYGEAAWVGGAGELGAGITVTRISGHFGISPSLGVIRRDAALGLAASVLIGFRSAETLPPADFASGLRLEVRRFDDEVAVGVALELDLVIPVLATAMLIAMTSEH